MSTARLSNSQPPPPAGGPQWNQPATPPVPVKPAANPLGGIIVLAIIGIGIWYFFLRTPTPVTPRSPIQPAATIRPPAPVNETLPGQFSGSSDQQTTAFQLAGGDYKVDWQASYTGEYPDIGCFFGASMQTTSETAYESVAFEDVTGTGVHRGTANLYNVDAGRWFFGVNSGCNWTLRLYR